MKKLVVGLIILIAMGFAVKELIGSRKPTKAPEASGYKFYYYPKLNVYYDATQNNFVYTVDGGITWQTKKPASPDLPEKLDQKVTIYSPDPDVWIHNSEHRQQYKGVSTNYVQRIQDTAQLSALPVPRKSDTGISTNPTDSIVKRDSTAKKEGETKKKSSSWFNRFKEKLKRSLKKKKEPQDDTL